jgi:RNA polymerase II subunit A small phosphatase-like protein
VKRPLLILDLDETIVSATEEQPHDGFDFRVFRYFVPKRPYLDKFLQAVHNWYELAVWSSSGDSYANGVVQEVFGDAPTLHFVWARSCCTRRFDGETGEYYFAKNLKKVTRKGFDLARVLIIDDSREKVRRHFGNHLRLRAFEGQPGDRELIDVLPFLEWLAGRENFREIEKRGWRNVGGA